MCLSTSCIHLALYVGLPPMASPPLLTFLLFQYAPFPCITNFLHAPCRNFEIPPALCKVHKTCTGPKRRRQDPKNIRPNVSAYNNGLLSPLLWKQGPQSRCTGPQNRTRCQKQISSLSRTIPSGPTQIHRGPQKLLPQGPGNTHASLPHFLWRQVQKKYGQVQKTCRGPKKGAKV